MWAAVADVAGTIAIILLIVVMLGMAATIFLEP